MMVLLWISRILLTAFLSLLCYFPCIEGKPLDKMKSERRLSYRDNKNPFISKLNSAYRALGENDNEKAMQLLDKVSKKFANQKIANQEKRTESKWQLGDFVLIRIVPRTKEQLSFLQSLQRKSSNNWIQFWRHPDAVNRHTDFWITPKNFNKYVSKLLPLLNIHFEIIKKDLKYPEEPFLVNMKNIENFDEVYHNLNEFNSEMMRLLTVYDDILFAEVIGKSFEKKPIHVVHLRIDISKTKPIIFLLCGIHPREWLAVSSCQYTLRRLVFDHKCDNDANKLLQHYDVAIVPVLNPDGYVYTREKGRMWRKTRSLLDDSSCKGVDLNRNFNYRWGAGGTSPDSCHEAFCGLRPFSESESLAVGKYLYHMRRKIVAFLDVHTYGQMWMSPWGFSRQYPRDYKEQEVAMRKIHEAIKKETGQHYRYGRSFTTLYQTSGTSMDWVYGLLNIVHTYGIELRPNYGTRYSPFVRPPKDIIPSGKDLYTGLTTLAKHMTEEKKPATVAKSAKTTYFLDELLTPPKQS